MKKFYFSSLSLLLLATNAWANSFEYPASRRTEDFDIFHGIKVNDPYRWLEEIDSQEVKKWVEDQNATTRKYIDSIPQKSKIEAMVKSFTAPSFAPPLHIGDIFYILSKGSLYSGNNESSPSNLLVNIQEITKNPKATISDMTPSPDGKKISLLVNYFGADLPADIFIYDIETNQLIENAVIKGNTNYLAQHWIRGPFWLDNLTLVYTKITLGKYKLPLKSSLVLHKIGTPISEDTTLFEKQLLGKQTEIWYGRPTSDKKFLLVETQSSEQEPTIVGLMEIGGENKIHWIRNGKIAHYVFLGDNGTDLFFRSGKSAKNLKISKFIISDILKNRIMEKTIVPEKSMPIHNALYANGKILVSYSNPMKQQSNEAYIYNGSGSELLKLELPGNGSIDSFRLSPQKNEIYFHYNDYFQPRTLMKFDLEGMLLSIINKPLAPFASEEFKVSTKTVLGDRNSPDIQYTTLEPSNLSQMAKAPLLLHFYGNVAGILTPAYTPKWLAWLRMGGRVVIAHVRGGPDKGRNWVDGGRANNKENTFKDVIRVTEHLIALGQTSSDKILLDGRSSGGFNVAAIANLRPDLFGVITSIVPMGDMIRYPKLAWGNRWLYEYGNPEIKKDFDVLYRVSPYHNAKNGTLYPSMIFFTAEHDDRVNAAHTYKLAAAYQNGNASENPIFLWEDKNASHSSKMEAVDELTFAAGRLNIQ